MNILAGLLIALAGVVGLGWLGLRGLPRPFDPPAAPGTSPQTVDLPADLPAPVRRYLEAALGPRLPVIETAIITGRMRLRRGPLRFPARLRFYYRAGEAYFHDIQATWFGLPFLHVEERFQDGKTLFKLPFARVDDDPLFNKAAFMGLWAEMIWLPALYATHPSLRWEAVDETSARLWFPSTEGEDSLLFTFDPVSGLPVEVSGQRNPNGKPELIGWRNRVLSWQTLAGMKVPAGAETIWENEGYAWATWSAEAIALNVDVSARLP